MTVSRTVQKEQLQLLNQWYLELAEQEKQFVLDSLREGYKETMAFIELKQPDLKEVFDYVLALLRQWGRDVSLKKLQARMRRYELDEELIGELSELAYRSLLLYRYAAFLRTSPDADFERMVSKIMVDNYVERRFNSYSLCAEYLGLSDEDAARDSYEIVMKLVEYHYGQLDTLEELGEFMEQELAFSSRQIEMFFQQLLTYRDAIDRFILFKRLRALESKISRLQTEA